MSPFGQIFMNIFEFLYQSPPKMTKMTISQFFQKKTFQQKRFYLKEKKKFDDLCLRSIYLLSPIEQYLYQKSRVLQILRKIKIENFLIYFCVIKVCVLQILGYVLRIIFFMLHRKTLPFVMFSKWLNKFLITRVDISLYLNEKKQ